MNKYKATYMRVETKVITIYCEAESEGEADEILYQRVSDSIQQEGDANTWIDFDEMECIHAEDYMQDIELCK